MWLYVLLTICGEAVCGEVFYRGLFGTVVRLVRNDTLNVREKPDYRSEKIGALPIGAVVGVDVCRPVGPATWCKIHHIAQYDYDAYGWDAKPGWVNAWYLRFSDTGYVLVDRKADCDYALKCYDTVCEVVDDYTEDADGHILSLSIRKIERKRLHAESHFGAMGEGEGYCVAGVKIEDYLTRKRTHELLKDDHEGIGKRVLKIVEALEALKYGDAEAFILFMYPLKGIAMTWGTRFGDNRLFGTDEIRHIESNRYDRIYWGRTDGKGSKVFMSLYDYMAMLTRPLFEITAIEPLEDLRGFRCDPKSECRGVEVRWVEEGYKHREFNWLGLVLILEKYRDDWYVVGLLRDRWTI